MASDPTVLRAIDALAVDTRAVLRTINAARAAARKTASTMAGSNAPDREISAASPLVIDLEAW